MAPNNRDDRPWRHLISARDFPPAAATVRVEFGADSRRGPGRQVNTDHFLVVQLDRRFETMMTSFAAPEVPDFYDEHGFALVLADGLGESSTAETASRLAIASLAHLALYFGRWNLRVDEPIARDIMQRVGRFYRYIDGMLVQSGRRDPETPLQSALTAVVSAGEQMFVAHVGHSRAYLLRQGMLVQLTRDHTLGARRLVEPTPVDVDALAKDGEHVVISTLGSRGHGPEVDIERLTLSDGDRVLVCSNGLSDVLDEARIVNLMAAPGPMSDIAHALVDAALAQGAADDVTAVVARYDLPPETHGP